MTPPTTSTTSAQRRSPLLNAVLGPFVRWARGKSRVGLAVVGALPGRDAEAWAHPRTLPIGVATDAPAPRQADFLVVVGRISHKLAPFIVRAHAAMARPTAAIVVELEAANPTNGAGDGSLVNVPRLYATVADVASIIPVDVIVRGHPPSPAMMARALAALDERLPGIAP